MSEQKLKIIFAGTPDFAATALQALLDAGHDICAVYCQPDRPSGRGKKLIAGPVKQIARDRQIPVEQPVNFKRSESSDINSIDSLERLSAYQADLMVVVAYGIILPSSVLNTPKYGCINIHGSLLPRWRGAAPVQRAIQAGDRESGITIMQMDEGLDTGNMLLKLTADIADTETGSSLHDKLAALGGEAIVNFLQLNQMDNAGEKQDGNLACYAHKLSKKEAEIDWNQNADVLERQIRAFNAWPVSYSYVGKKRLRVWLTEITENKTTRVPGAVVSLEKSGIEIACGDQKTLRLTILQPDGSKAMSAEALLNSRKDWFEENSVLGKHD